MPKHDPLIPATLATAHRNAYLVVRYPSMAPGTAPEFYATTRPAGALWTRFRALAHEFPTWREAFNVARQIGGLTCTASSYPREGHHNAQA